MSSRRQPTANDTALITAIDPWLQHMRWRRDFAAWREQRINQEHFQSDRLEQAMRFVGSLRNKVVLDVGAGMGGFAVAAALQGAQVAACDFNRAYCRITKLRAARNNAQVAVYNAVGEALPFSDASFNLVVSWDVIEHVQSPRAMLGELQRVLAPGGTALVTVINRWAWKDPHYHLRGINWLPRSWAERIITWRGRSKHGTALRDMQRLSEMHYFSYPDFVRLAGQFDLRVADLQEAKLAAGTLYSPKRIRRVLRALLHVVGFEHIAYRLQRHWYVGMFELALIKEH